MFEMDERVYVIDLKVDEDNVLVRILTVNTHDIAEKGSSKPTRYMGALKFHLPPEMLRHADVTQVKAVVDEVLPFESEFAAAPPPTIGLGQTQEEVEAILGKPARIVDLGTKVTYFYEDMKVIFEGGKVIDVQ